MAATTSSLNCSRSRASNTASACTGSSSATAAGLVATAVACSGVMAGVIGGNVVVVAGSVVAMGNVDEDVEVVLGLVAVLAVVVAWGILVLTR